jgi:hypothetical protein
LRRPIDDFCFAAFEMVEGVGLKFQRPTDFENLVMRA